MATDTNTGTRQMVGGIVSLISGLILIILSVVYLFSEYDLILKGFFEGGKPPGTVMQSFHQPIFMQILAFAGVLLIVGGYGFLIKRSWAWLTSFTGSTIGVFATFMLMMFPLMVLMPMKHTSTFLVSAITWFLLVAYVKPHAKKLIAFSFACGMAMTMTFMNGNAALNKIIGVHLKLKQAMPQAVDVGMIKMQMGNPALTMQAIQQILWIGALGFFIMTFAVLYRKDWVLPVGIGSAIISIAAGIPVAYIDTMGSKGGEELSMFSFAPILATIILILLLVFREKIWAEPDSTNK